MTPRGACPSLAAPMPTGDGLLLRAPPGWWSPAVVLAIADAADRFGNGVVEITARGSLQIRGLRAETAEACADALVTGGIVDAPPVLVGPLAGRDRSEIADPRGIAAAIVEGWPEGLAAKTSVVVDGGGALHLDAVGADLRLVAVDASNWAMGLGDKWLARVPVEEAAPAALAALRHLGTRRAREVATESTNPPPASRAPAEPIGWHAAGALGVAGAFGALEARTLAAFADAAPPDSLLRPAPGRALLVLGLNPAQGAALREKAAAFGLVTDPADPRRRIAACPGSPACASGEAATRELAASLAMLAELPPGIIHISGCAKGCAHPGPAAITLVGCDGGFGLVRGGVARDHPACHLAPRDIAAALKEWPTP
ncbi:MAG: precorrin-3B synthase [Rubritepida sp.]|nr:precorrin-3B synthase [Rubritepida sp.]